jgi:hypothetical protein
LASSSRPHPHHKAHNPQRPVQSFHHQPPRLLLRQPPVASTQQASQASASKVPVLRQCLVISDIKLTGSNRLLDASQQARRTRRIPAPSVTAWQIPEPAAAVACLAISRPCRVQSRRPFSLLPSRTVLPYSCPQLSQSRSLTVPRCSASSDATTPPPFAVPHRCCFAHAVTAVLLLPPNHPACCHLFVFRRLLICRRLPPRAASPPVDVATHFATPQPAVVITSPPQPRCPELFLRMPPCILSTPSSPPLSTQSNTSPAHRRLPAYRASSANRRRADIP